MMLKFGTGKWTKPPVDSHCVTVDLSYNYLELNFLSLKYGLDYLSLVVSVKWNNMDEGILQMPNAIEHCLVSQLFVPPYEKEDSFLDKWKNKPGLGELRL